MSKIKHSPLPWMVYENDFGCDTIQDANGDTVTILTDAIYPEGATSADPDDGAFIVLACNYHARLVDALHDLTQNDCVDHPSETTGEPIYECRHCGEAPENHDTVLGYYQPFEKCESPDCPAVKARRLLAEIKEAQNEPL